LHLSRYNCRFSWKSSVLTICISIFQYFESQPAIFLSNFWRKDLLEKNYFLTKLSAQIDAFWVENGDILVSFLAEII
jgi:hypothetical protein